MPASRVDPGSAVARWLEAFASAVRDRDYAGARALCAPDVEGFGTVADRYVGIDRLEHEQWRSVWDRTDGFAFDLDGASTWADGDLVVVIAEWSSVGVEADGSTRRRKGRTTIALAGEGPLAVHTHFSMDPGTRA